jgi:tRNA(Arg) A34 adenosine deaminase TadA
MHRDEFQMRLALYQARKAAQSNEVPIGALIFDPSSGEIKSIAANAPILTNDPCAHAEILAIRQAGKEIGNYRLNNLWLYVTLEPCAMCAGAIAHARLSRLIYGASDPKGGAVENGPRLFDQATINHRPEITKGILAQECSQILKSFFKDKRINKNPG